MEVIEVNENEDGSADYEFSLDEVESEMLFESGLRAIATDPVKFGESYHREAREAVIRLGIMTAIARGIHDAQEAEASKA